MKAGAIIVLAFVVLVFGLVIVCLPLPQVVLQLSCERCLKATLVNFAMCFAPPSHVFFVQGVLQTNGQMMGFPRKPELSNVVGGGVGVVVGVLLSALLLIHVRFLVISLVSVVILVVFVWFAFGSPLAPFGLALVALWFSSVSLWLRWFTFGMPLVCLWFLLVCPCFPLGFPWVSLWLPFGFPLVCHGFFLLPL